MIILTSLIAACLALGGPASIQTGRSVALLGGDHINAYGHATKRSNGLLFDLEAQQFVEVADSGVDRAKHSVVEVDGLWYLFGGATSDVQTFDVRSGQYGVAPLVGDAPAPRTGHSAVAYGATMYVLGGELSDGTLDAALRLYDTKSGVWRELASPLGGVTEHSAVVYDGLMWVFGGRDANGVALGALWTFDLRSELWAAAASVATPSLDDAPAARAGHAALVVDDEMLLFGGVSADGRYLNDVWALHLDARERRAPSWQRAAVVDSGTAPAARAYASLAFHDNALWLLGGRDAKQSFLDVWALDLEFLQWELIACMPGTAFPQCREAAIKMQPPAEQALSAFRFVSPGVSEATYTLQLHSAPTHPVHVACDIDAGHVQVTPAELIFDESNWNQPQTVRVLVLEDLFLPGDAAELSITHETRSLDQHYKRSTLPPRPVTLPSICGDGRCLGDENYVNCALDCRNAGAEPFCGDGLCHEETYQSCPDDCSVQGTDNTCDAAHPVRCRSGECVASAHACATRARSTASSCAADESCQGAKLVCDAGHALCPDGTCAAHADMCAMLEPCPAGLKRCFDTSCQSECGAESNRCPPAVPNLNLFDAICRGEPRGEVAIENAMRDYATLTTIHRPTESTSRVWLLANHGSAYYGQIAFPGGSLDGGRVATCPCNDAPMDASMNDPMVGVKVVALDDAKLPKGAFGGFELTMPHNHAGSFAPHVAQVWIAHMRTDIAHYCLGAHNADDNTWFCIDESLHTSSKDASCACEIKHTRGSFGRNYHRFAFIVDNCPNIDNADQTDSDNDGVGDACDELPYGGAAIDLSCGGNTNKAYVESLIAEVKTGKSNVDCPASPYI